MCVTTCGLNSVLSTLNKKKIQSKLRSNAKSQKLIKDLQNLRKVLTLLLEHEDTVR
jgi:hypothetical protein